MLQNITREAMKVIPNFPTKCPISPRNISKTSEFFHGTKNGDMNRTADDFKKTKNFQLPFLTPTLLPNGLHRTTILIFNEEDSNIMTMSWTTDNYIRLNEEEF